MDGQYKQDAGKIFVTMLSLWIRHFRRKTCRHSKKASFFQIPEKVSEDIWLLRSEPWADISKQFEKVT
jgi:hypothetical protein